MRRTVLKVVGFFASAAFVVGCGEKSTTPTNMNQSLPKVVGSDGSSPKVPGGNTGGKIDGSKKSPNASAD
jgi:hypothetical protein